MEYHFGLLHYRVTQHKYIGHPLKKKEEKKEEVKPYETLPFHIILQHGIQTVCVCGVGGWLGACVCAGVQARVRTRVCVCVHAPACITCVTNPTPPCANFHKGPSP